MNDELSGKISAMSALNGVDDDSRLVMLAMALLWSPHPLSAIHTLMRKLDFKHRNGHSFMAEEIRFCLPALLDKQLVSEPRPGYFRVAEPARGLLYEELFGALEVAVLRRALYETEGYSPQHTLYSWPLLERDPTIAIVRLSLLTRTGKFDIERMSQLIGRNMDWRGILQAALLQHFTPTDFARIDPELSFDFAQLAVQDFCAYWDADLQPLAEWTLTQAANLPERLPNALRCAAAELLLHKGQRAQALTVLAGLQDSHANALRAYALAQESRWEEAQELFESALKQRHSEAGAKKRAFPVSFAWVYPLALLAQQTPRHLELARKFCLNESGKRDPDSSSGWGQWVHAIDIKRGDSEPDPALQRAAEYYGQHVSLDHFWRVLIGAWVGMETMRDTGAYRTALGTMARNQAATLRRIGLDWLAFLADGAQQVINGQEAPEGFFLAGKNEHWRDLLSALQTLGEESTEAAAENARFAWMLDIAPDGALRDIQLLEQQMGVRGWNTPRPVTLGRIVGNPQLAPWDAKVANCLRSEKGARRGVQLDMANAIQALVGHPHVVLKSSIEQFVELSEATPEIEVAHQGDQIVLKVTPPLRAGDPGHKHYYDEAEKREAEALHLITLVPDGAQRVRLYRFTPAQRRAAQLLADKVSIPASAQHELNIAMQALTSHFQLQSDHLQAAREVPAETRLRAELAPFGDGLLLRLVATPLGSDGPRMPPGSGRTRLMAMVGGESTGTTRELDIERRHMESVLDALPFLESCRGNSRQCEWEVPVIDDALALVEVLPTLPGIAALDWPKGKAVKVVTLDEEQLAMRITSARNWFKLDGEVRADEGMVFTFQALLAAAESSSRFVAMGNGTYAALTRKLKERLSNLAAVSETDAHGTRVPRLAAVWLDDVLQDIRTETDSDFQQAIEQLHRAQQQNFVLPGTLQAELRPYQEDGYQWASRLAQAGFGACLADDMGLGKTLQSLALLLARAEGGPALVIAPTSVCGNWVSEGERFAPSLNLHLYGAADRATVVEAAGARDVVVVSYTLLQQAAEQFAAKRWHTVIADEAQAIKNASAKRSQAVFELQADFRLALSGTPVENRLAELWSIMRFINPGLLGSSTRFNERFAAPIEREKDRDAQHTLRRLIAPFLLRRTKSQVLQELPPRTELVIKIAPGVEEASHYEALRRQAITEADKALASNSNGQARMNILAQLTRLRRAACDPRVVTPGFPASGSKVQTFVTLAQELVANGHKALVFSQFVDFLTLLRTALDEIGASYQYLDGATPAAERSKRVDAFQGGQGDFFLISLKAGGFGLNLTAADYVVITDPWWNPAAEDQAMGRAHRMGQLRPVTVYRLVTQGTVEEHIVGLHNDKRALAESILGEGEAVSLPSTDELISLIRGE